MTAEPRWRTGTPPAVSPVAPLPPPEPADAVAAPAEPCEAVDADVLAAEGTFLAVVTAFAAGLGAGAAVRVWVRGGPSLLLHARVEPLLAMVGSTADGALVWQEAENRLHAQKGLLSWLLEQHRRGGDR